MTERKRPADDPVSERLSLEVLHDQILDVVIVTDVVERADIGVREC